MATVHFKSKPLRLGGGFVAWCAAGKLTGPDPIAEPQEDVWFEFGRTRDEAVDRMKASVAGHWPGAVEWVEDG